MAACIYCGAPDGQKHCAHCPAGEEAGSQAMERWQKGHRAGHMGKPADESDNHYLLGLAIGYRERQRCRRR